MFGLVVIAALGASIPVLVLTAAVIYMPGAFRFARAMAVNINAMDFIRVARARGEGTLYIMRAEILPNMVLPVLTDFGLRFVFVVLLLSGLSFLGLGIQPPAADWGSLVRENLEGLSYGAPAVIMPALAIASLTIGVNLLIDNLPTRRAADDVR
jgi:peptide/nickel transport system permease protein